MRRSDSWRCRKACRDAEQAEKRGSLFLTRGRASDTLSEGPAFRSAHSSRGAMLPVRIVVAAALAIAFVGADASASAAVSRPTVNAPVVVKRVLQEPWFDPTEYWSSPGAVWIARQLNGINPNWRVTATGLDQFARDWCYANDPQQLSYYVNKLILGTTPGADLRALPALGQMLRLIGQSCIYQGGDPATVDYWIQVTANYMMTVVRNNTRAQIRSERTAWTRPPPPIPAKAKSSVSSSVIAGACNAAVELGGQTLVGRFTKLSGLKAMGVYGLAKIGCNKLVTKIWERAF